MWSYGMWWGGLIWLVLLGAVVWALLAATNGPTRSTRLSAIDILGERFARGEIDADIYRSTRTELERN